MSWLRFVPMPGLTAWRWWTWRAVRQRRGTLGVTQITGGSMRRTRLLLSFVLSVGLAGGLGLGGPAAAQPGWTPAVDVSDPARPVELSLMQVGVFGVHELVRTARIALWPGSAVGPNMHGQPPSITVMPC